LTNNGSIVLTNGATTIDAPVVNQANELIRVAYGSATFSGNVTNSGTIAISQASVTFSKTFTDYGTVVTDTTGEAFSTLALQPTGLLIGGASVASLQMNGGAIATGAGALSLTGSLASTGAGSSISGNLNLGGTNRTFNVASGGGPVDLGVSATVSNGSITKTGAGTLLLSGSVAMAGFNANNGATQLAQSGSIGALSVAVGATFALTAHTGGAYNVLEISSLAISGFSNKPGTGSNAAKSFTADAGSAAPASPEDVPEPGVAGLLFTGLLGVLARRRAHRRPVSVS